MPASDNFPIEYGEYRLLKKVAQGGMAEIFLAQDKRGQICAIKRILPHLAHEESFIRMFIDEARIVSHLDHPNIAGVKDQGKVDGYYFIAMEFVQGHSLLAVSERAKSMKIPLPRGLLSYVVAELLGGLACAHAARDNKGRHLGIVHRDVTPQNVLISYDGEVKLIDFGVAKARARLTQTEAGFTKGKLSYMSPEQARGEELDGRSDLFSVGIILHEITTNSRLFNKEGPGGILGAIVNDPIPPPSLRAKDYPKELEAVVMKGLDKDLNRRWQSAEEMKEALLRYAKKEKPAPSAARLKDLIHDLFGDPESQRWIDEAQATSAPTPPHVQTHAVLRDGSIKVSKSAIPATKPPPQAEREESDTRKVDDETRMLRPEYELKPQKSKVERKLEITSPGVPALEMPIDQDRPVPEPTVPFRVRLARYLLALSLDLRVSWREHRLRWVLGILGASAAVFLVFGVWTGAVGAAWVWLSGAAEGVKALRASSGVTDEVVDAGLMPTVLRLSSDPPGAAILIDGVGVGTVTPADLPDLPTGRPLAVELSLLGYRSKKQNVTLFLGQGVREMSLALERQVGEVQVESDPPEAAVYVNGKKTELLTPAKVSGLAAGVPVTIKVSKKGRVSASKVVVPGDDQVRSVSFELAVDENQIPPGTIEVTTSPGGCQVWVDDQRVGTSPLSGYDVRAGAHRVKVACENYGQEDRSVSVGPGQTEKLSFSLRPTVFGYLTIKALPEAGSEIQIGGKTVPQPIEFLKVIPGNHRIVVVNRGLNMRREVSVDVRANDRVTRTINLLQ